MRKPLEKVSTRQEWDRTMCKLLPQCWNTVKLRLLLQLVSSYSSCADSVLSWTHYRWRKVKVCVTQLCPTLCNPMNCSLPGSSIHQILQARILEWVATPFSRGSSWCKDLGFPGGSDWGSYGEPIVLQTVLSCRARNSWLTWIWEVNFVFIMLSFFF